MKKEQIQERAGEIAGLILNALVAVGPAINVAANKTTLSLKQVLLLAKLGRHPTGLAMTDIARWCGNSTAAATGLIDRLEKMGYVERAHSRDDRRRVIVSPAQRGESALAQWRADMETELAEALDADGDGAAPCPTTVRELGSIFDPFGLAA